jgi:uncharacterized protein
VTVYVDTSALLALLDADEEQHPTAASQWQKLVLEEERLVASSYVLVEAFAVVQRRLGMEALRALERDVLPLVEIEWVGEDVHRIAAAALLVANRRGLSLVDCASFEVMRRRGLKRAFAIDPHFGEQGFDT